MTTTIQNLLDQANSYTGDNIFQDIFYQSDLVDVDVTEDAVPNTAILFSGSSIEQNESTGEWEIFDN